jgi:hypothetical protein
MKKLFRIKDMMPIYPNIFATVNAGEEFPIRYEKIINSRFFKKGQKKFLEHLYEYLKLWNPKFTLPYFHGGINTFDR